MPDRGASQPVSEERPRASEARGAWFFAVALVAIAVSIVALRMYIDRGY